MVGSDLVTGLFPRCQMFPCGSKEKFVMHVYRVVCYMEVRHGH